MNRNNVLDGNSRQYIRIRDCEMLETIGKLLPYYNSFNMLANDALQLGLPLLLASKLDDTVRLEEEPRLQQIEVKCVYDNHMIEIIRLLQEIAMNTGITKPLVCSLFNAKSAELNDKPLLARHFDNGAMRDTPSCLAKFEVDMLNAMD